MEADHRKSILNVQTVELQLTQSKSQSPLVKLSPLVPRKSFLSQTSISSKKLPRPSLELKIKRLNDMKLTSLFEKESGVLSGFRNVPKPKICISELWGSKETYLSKTGYLAAYHELKKKNELDKLKAVKSNNKVLTPRIADMKAKNKALLRSNRSNEEKHYGNMFPIREDGKSSMKEDHIEKIIQKCNELSKKTVRFKKQSEKVSKVIVELGNKKNLAKAKIDGLSLSTSEELLKSNYSWR